MEVLRHDDPRTVGAYRLIGRLGAGGMGQVYLGRSRGGRMVAVKLVHASLAKDPLFRRRFRLEVEAARRVGGEWTAPVLDADTESESPWVATGYVPGPTLAETVERHGPLPEASVLALASGLTRALQAVHAAGLIHRDLKPSNVLVTIDGPKVIDFGIARSVDASVATRTGALIGSPAYMSPEQARGAELSPASDVFSLGSVLAYAATGRQPFGEGLSGLHAVILQVAQGDPQLHGLSGPLRSLVESCLGKAPERRPAVEAVLNWLPAPSASWLPVEVVAELGRHAAALLDLEGPGLQTTVHDAPSPERFRPSPAHAPTIGREPAGTRPGRLRPASRGRRMYPVIAAAAVAVLAAGSAAFALAADNGHDPSGRAATGQKKAEGVLPPAVLGSWQGSYETKDHVGNTFAWHRRITLTQGPLGADVATIRVTGDHGEEGGLSDRTLCEYIGRLASSTPAVDLRPRLTRSVPPGRCPEDPPQKVALTSKDRVRWVGDGVSGDFSRARNKEIHAGLHGRWIAKSPSGARKEFVIGGGAVGTEAVRSRVIGPDGQSHCESMSVLVSADYPIMFMPIRFTKPGPECVVLAPMQTFQTRGEHLIWAQGHYGDGEEVYLKHA